MRLRRNARDFLVRQRAQTVNAIRAHLGEFGPRGPWFGRNAPPERFVRASPPPSPSVVAKGIHNVDRLLDAARDLSPAARPALDMLAGHLRDTQARIEEVTARIGEMQGEDALARRLATVPGVGTISSSAFAATTPDVAAFRSARDYAASCWKHAFGVTLGVRSVSRTDRVPTRTAAGPFQWRQGEARADLQSRQSVPAQAALPRRHDEPSRRHAFETDGE